MNKLKVRLREKPQVLKQYDDVIKDQLEQGIIEIVDDKKEIDINNVTYLPHREVIKEDKKSAKLRIVFDASAKGRNGVSLNDCLYIRVPV